MTKASELCMNHQLDRDIFEDVFVGRLKELGFLGDEGWSQEFYEGFDGDVFYLKAFHWGDCTCSRDSGSDEFNEPEEHEWDCLIYKPNFIHKPSGLMISWYKHPLRGNACNVDIDIEDFTKIMRSLVL